VDQQATAGVSEPTRTHPTSKVAVAEIGSADAIADLGSALDALSSRIARRERDLTRLFDRIVRDRNALLDSVLDRLFGAFSGIIPFDTLECAFLSEDAQQVSGYWRKSARRAQHPTWSAPWREARLRSAPLGRDPVIIRDLRTGWADGGPTPVAQHFIDRGACSLLACPLIADGVALGFLFFTARNVDVFRPAHAVAFRRAAAQVSLVVQKTRAYGEALQGSRTLISETQRWREAATIDALTGVLNRRALDARLQASWIRFEQDRVPFGLIFCDLDRFKQVNDTHGHGVGDRVLAHAAQCLSRSLRGGDAFGRYGGEEFLAVVLTGSEQTLASVAQRLKRMLTPEPGTSIPVAASFGIAAATHFTSLADLVAAADRALYDAKHRGGNCCVLATSATELVLLPERAS